MSQTINGTQRRDGFFFGVRNESVPALHHVGSEWTQRVWLRQIIPGNAFAMKRAKKPFLWCFYCDLPLWKSLTPSPLFLHSSWKDAIPPPLWLLWYWVTQRLILEMIEIKLFLVFFSYRAVISSAHNLLSCLSMGWLAAVTYTFSFPA